MHNSKSDHHVISHDPNTYVAPESPMPPKKTIPIAILAVLGFILIAVGGVWYLNGQSFNFSNEPTEEFTIEPVDETVIATVGAEKIYGEDLKYKKSQVPENLLSPEDEAELLQRLIDESIILQAGAEADYIELDGSTFNTPIKNQRQRQILITEVTDMVNQNASYVKGAYVSIWFMNNEPGPIGYEEGKRVAQQKISQLHNSVRDGSMTIKQAGEAIRNDASLAQLDPTSYQSNAYREFDSSQESRIIFDQTFNDELLSLQTGEVSDVALIEDHPESDPDLPKQDAVYMFGQVTEVKTDGVLPFDQWLESQRANYEVITN